MKVCLARILEGKLRLAVLDKGKNHYMVENEKEVQLADDLINIEEFSFESLELEINEFLLECGGKGMVYVVLPTVQGVSNASTFTMEGVKKKELKKAIHYRIIEEFNIETADFKWKYDHVRNNDYAIQMIDKKLIKGLMGLSLTKGYQLKGIYLETMLYVQAPGAQARAVIETDEDNTRMYSYIDEKPYTYRRIEGLDNDSHSERWIEEINGFLFDLEVHHRIKPEELFVTKPIEVEFDGRVGLPMKALPISNEMISSFEGVSKTEKAYYFLSEMKRIRKQNFLETDIKKNLFYFINSFVVASLVATSLVGLIFQREAAKMESLNNDQSNNLMQVQEENMKKQREISKKREELVVNQSLFQELESYYITKDDKFISKWLEELQINTPKKLKLNELWIEKQTKTILLKGEAEGYSPIGFFAIALEKQAKVTIDNIQYELQGAKQETTTPTTPTEETGTPAKSESDEASGTHRFEMTVVDSSHE